MAGDDSMLFFTLAKALLGFGVPLALGIWQLVSIKRQIRADREREAQAAATESAAEPATADASGAIRERLPEPA
jgi:hypothetical protein